MNRVQIEPLIAGDFEGSFKRRPNGLTHSWCKCSLPSGIFAGVGKDAKAELDANNQGLEDSTVEITFKPKSTIDDDERDSKT